MSELLCCDICGNESDELDHDEFDQLVCAACAGVAAKYREEEGSAPPYEDQYTEEYSDRSKFRVRVIWNSDADPEPIFYEFATESEAKAFMLGISEADGWLEAESVELNRPT